MECPTPSSRTSPRRTRPSRDASSTSVRSRQALRSTRWDRRASGPLLTGAEDDGVDHRDLAALRLRKREIREPAHDTAHDGFIGQVGSAVVCRCDASVLVDREFDSDASLQVRILAQAVLVAESKATEVLA